MHIRGKGTMHAYIIKRQWLPFDIANFDIACIEYKTSTLKSKIYHPILE